MDLYIKLSISLLFFIPILLFYIGFISDNKNTRPLSYLVLIIVLNMFMCGIVCLWTL